MSYVYFWTDRDLHIFSGSVWHDMQHQGGMMQQTSGMSMAYPQQGVPPPPNQPPLQQQYQVGFVILYVLCHSMYRSYRVFH